MLKWHNTSWTSQPTLTISSKQCNAREREVIQQMSQGKSNQEIAGELGISESTLKYHINIF
jgi:DNA-binding CsgD family transcriptional regulator